MSEALHPMSPKARHGAPIHFGLVRSGPPARIGLPIREYLAAVLPGLGNRSIQSLDQLTPAAYAANKAK